MGSVPRALAAHAWPTAALGVGERYVLLWALRVLTGKVSTFQMQNSAFRYILAVVLSFKKLGKWTCKIAKYGVN
jgi:hypothetical protein